MGEHGGEMWPRGSLSLVYSVTIIKLLKCVYKYIINGNKIIVGSNCFFFLFLDQPLWSYFDISESEKHKIKLVWPS